MVRFTVHDKYWNFYGVVPPLEDSEVAHPIDTAPQRLVTSMESYPMDEITVQICKPIEVGCEAFAPRFYR